MNQDDKNILVGEAWDGLEEMNSIFMFDTGGVESYEIVKHWREFNDDADPQISLLEYIAIQRFRLERGREYNKVAIARKLVEVLEEIREEIRGLT